MLPLSNDRKTTILGLLAGSILAAKIDWLMLFKGDRGQLGLLLGAVVAAMLGYYTNKPGES